MARASWYYYIEGLTQNDIAARLGVHRTRVNRILAQARTRGIVQVRINSPVNLAAERALEKRFGLKQVVLVQTPQTPDQLATNIANAAGAIVSDRLKSGMTLGVGWGRTLRMSVQSMERKHIDKLSVISLLGGLMRGSVMNTYETASHLADIYNADCFYIAAPAFADTEEMANMFKRQSSVGDALDRARGIDIALISVGALHANSTMARLDLIDKDEEAALREAGAVGDLCAQWIDIEGRVVDHELNRRVIALPVTDLNTIPNVVLASGGEEKIPVILGALNRGSIDVLVTDEGTGHRLLKG